MRTVLFLFIVLALLSFVELRNRQDEIETRMQSASVYPKPTLKIIAFASQINSRLCTMLKSSLSHSIPVKIIGSNVTEVPFFHLAAKPKFYVKEALLNSKTRPATHFIYADAYDTIFQSGQDEIMAAYAKIGVQVVYSAEKNCWPSGKHCNQFDKHLDVAEMYENSRRDQFDYTTDYYPHYLNSGLMMCSVDECERWYSFSMQEKSLEKIRDNDQHLAQMTHLTLKEVTSRLDAESALFQSMFGSIYDVVFRDGAWHNIYTGTKPAVVHFNGNKQFYEKIAGKLQFDEEKIKDSLVEFEEGIFRKYGEICSNSET